MRCKPGDLAVIVRCDYQQNIGRLVTVVRRVDSQPTSGEWLCIPEGSPLAAQSPTGKDILSVQVLCPDEWLRPIRPGDTADSTEIMKEKEAA